eukprot:3168135-Pyramimonas_sp.AAC.1
MSVLASLLKKETDDFAADVTRTELLEEGDRRTSVIRGRAIAAAAKTVQKSEVPREEREQPAMQPASSISGSTPAAATKQLTDDEELGAMEDELFGSPARPPSARAPSPAQPEAVGSSPSPQVLFSMDSTLPSMSSEN